MLFSLVTIFFVGTLVAGVYYSYIRPTRQKINFLISTGILAVEPKYLLSESNLPLKNLGVLLTEGSEILAGKDFENCKLQVVFPKLTAAGDVEYIYDSFKLSFIHIPSVHKDQVTDAILETAKELSVLIREHVQFVEPEILSLQAQSREVRRLIQLVNLSDVYSVQRELYERALDQIETLLTKAEELERGYVRFIRDLLIGMEISGYDPNLLSGSSLAIDTRHRLIKEEYQMLKDTATAYAELMRTSQI